MPKSPEGGDDMQQLQRREVSRMAQRKVEVSYDKDKADALDVFLKVKDSYIELEITKQIDGLYHKTVPATVRDFISRKQEMTEKREEE